MSTGLDGRSLLAGDGSDAEGGLNRLQAGSYSAGARIMSFDQAAASYRAHAHVQLAMADWLAEWLPMIRAGQALEIGAGPGLFTQKIHDWPGGVTATDVSSAMCAVGRLEIPQMEWRVMAAEEPLPGPWCWIFTSSMLQWIQSPETVFSTWRSCLEPGGRVLAGLFAAGSLSELRQVSDGYDPLVWRTPAEWRACLTRAGLRIVREDTQRRVFTYGSAREFLRTLHGVGAAPRRRFPLGRMRRLLHDYDVRFREPEGVRATWIFYRFEAERMT